MLSGCAIVVAVDARHREIIQTSIKEYAIPVDSTGILSKRTPAYYLEKNMNELIYFYSKTENLNISFNIDIDPLTHQVNINELLCQFIEKFKNLCSIKPYFLESSYLLLIYEDKIDQNNLIEFTPKLLALLSELGLGISYNIVPSDSL